MKRLSVAAAFLALLLTGAVVWTRLPARTPAGQPPLAELSTSEAVRSEFNRLAGKTRVIILLSPT